ncbi:MAG: signal peptidase II [Candidatus Dormibacteria bacterium]
MTSRSTPPRRSLQFAVLGATAAAVFGIDHLTKWLVTQHLALGEKVGILGPISIDHVENQGAAFGLFPQLQLVFLGVALLVAIYILVAGRRFGPGIFPQVVLGAVLGGAVANAVDRVAQGHVVDFIDLRWWPVFNVADMAIVLGILVGVLTLRTHDPAAREPDSDVAA